MVGTEYTYKLALGKLMKGKLLLSKERQVKLKYLGAY